MSKHSPTLLVVGATGSIGRLVVDEALQSGYAVRALVRDVDRARNLSEGAARTLGDITRQETLRSAVDKADAIVFTHGSNGDGKAASESIDYGGVRNVLAALGTNKPRIALMTTIGVTDRKGAYNRANEAHDWKRRAERLVRASGLAYTIVRPGWFDYNDKDQQRLVMLQGDTRHAGNPSDGVVARRQIAQTLVRSLSSSAATGKTFELVAERGPRTEDFDPLFAALEPDTPRDMDGVRDVGNMPLAEEPDRVVADLRRQSGP